MPVRFTTALTIVALITSAPTPALAATLAPAPAPALAAPAPLREAARHAALEVHPQGLMQGAAAQAAAAAPVAAQLTVDDDVARATVPALAPAPLREAAHRATLEVYPQGLMQGVEVQAASTAPVSAQSTDQDRPWVVRHPALTGALLGAGIGVPIGIATCASPTAEHGNCSTYTDVGAGRGVGAFYVGGIGAGLGALAGFVASKLYH